MTRHRAAQKPVRPCFLVSSEDAGRKVVREVGRDTATIASSGAAEFTKVQDTVNVLKAHRLQLIEFVG
jgi:hypothetical protein